jgi:hypothetical protein
MQEACSEADREVHSGIRSRTTIHYQSPRRKYIAISKSNQIPLPLSIAKQLTTICSRLVDVERFSFVG